MRTYFRSLSDVLGSPLAQTAQTFSPRHAGGHRVLKSTKLEDAAYRDLRWKKPAAKSCPPFPL